MAKRMKIDLYCRRQNCSPINVLFSDVAGCSSVRVYKNNTVGENGDFVSNTNGKH